VRLLGVEWQAASFEEYDPHPHMQLFDSYVLVCCELHVHRTYRILGALVGGRGLRLENRGIGAIRRAGSRTMWLGERYHDRVLLVVSQICLESLSCLARNTGSLSSRSSMKQLYDVQRENLVSKVTIEIQ
jgi:hypothetical protein